MAETILKIIIFLDTKDIPKRLLEECIREERGNKEQVDSVIDILQKYSMIYPTDNGYGIDNLVQTEVRNILDEVEKRRYILSGTMALKKLWSNDKSSAEIPKGPEQLIPHIKIIGENVKIYKIKSNEILDLIIDVGIDLLEKVRDRSVKDQLNIAIEILEFGINIYNDVYGNLENAKLANLLNSIGSAWYHKGETTKAIEYTEKALKIFEKIEGPEGVTVAIVSGNLGSIYEKNREIDKAIECYKKALKIDEKRYGPEHSRVLRRLKDLGQAWQIKRTPDKAIKYYERALKIGEKIYGSQHPEVKTYLNNLGWAWRDKGDLEKAMECHERVLKMNVKTYGAESTQMAESIKNLGIIWQDKGDLKKAIRHMERALKIAEKTCRMNHPTTKSIQETLQKAQALQKQSRLRDNRSVTRSCSDQEKENPFEEKQIEQDGNSFQGDLLKGMKDEIQTTISTRSKQNDTKSAEILSNGGGFFNNLQASPQDKQLIDDVICHLKRVYGEDGQPERIKYLEESKARSLKNEERSDLLSMKEQLTTQPSFQTQKPTQP